MIYHFIFGLKENFGNKPFQYFHYLTIKSCYLTQNKPEIWIHFVHEPNDNIWWEEAKQYCKIKKYDTIPEEIFVFLKNIRDLHFVLIADVFRLLILKEHGGVYADMDTLFYRPFFPHFENKSFVMGLEEQFHKKNNKILTTGLCNALMICEKQSKFIDVWLNSYEKHFINPKDLNKMAVRIPHGLNVHNNLVHVEPVESFFKYLWSKNFYNEIIEDEKWVWDYNTGDEGIFSKHLYEGMNYGLLKTFTPDFLLKSNSLFAKMCRNIDGLL